MKKRKLKVKNLFLLFLFIGLIIGLFFKIMKKEDIIMKDFIGLNKEEFIKFADDNKLKYDIKEEYSSYDKNLIVSQSINKDEVIDDKISITISLGKAEDAYIKYSVNELGRVPVMMYHGIHDIKSSDTKYTGGNVDKDGYQRTAEAFINDLEFYYENGYRMVRLIDYVNGKIDVEMGYSPIVLTFDDGLKNNINVTGLTDDGNIIIDPNSAVGILESFKKKYPDFNVTATFFVNSSMFEQSKYTDKIMKFLVDNGYDIGNHTLNHVNFSNVSKETSIKEVGGMYQKLDEVIKDKYVNIVALPFGSPYSKTHANFSSILSGNYNGFEYKTESTLRVGWESDYSPFSKNFDKYFIKRIRAYDNNGVDFDIEMNFKNLKNNRYISDGDASKIVVPKDYENSINNDYGLEIITY